jgi:hypothetical protein
MVTAFATPLLTGTDEEIRVNMCEAKASRIAFAPARLLKQFKSRVHFGYRLSDAHL